MASPWLQGAMSRAKTTGEPKLSAVAQIPTMDSLAERIRAATNELVTAQAEHDRIKIAKQNVEDGTLTEIIDKNPLALPPFGSLWLDGPWDDLIAYRFRCTDCGELFSLHAETYHGQGGAWEPERKAALQ